MKSIRKLVAILALTLSGIGNDLYAAAEEEPEGKMTAVFVNQHPRDEITLYWVNPDMSEDDPRRLRIEATIPPRGGAHHSQTFFGHEFYYTYRDEHNYISADRPNANDEQLIIIGGRENEGVRVRCEISINSGRAADFFDIMVQPYWAPRGASRFLELVRLGYYNGVAFNRVVPKFLIQFGIGKDFQARSDAKEVAIFDDVDLKIPFEPGYISYAGVGYDSRTSEIFIAMPGASKEQLGRFGENSWETPFGFVEGDLSILEKIYSGYGDMPPWGKGPDPQMIYPENGYKSYLPKKFPKLDSVQSCYVVEEAGVAEEL